MVVTAFMVQCAFSVGYLQTEFLRSEEMRQPLQALAKGQTEEARSSVYGLYRSTRYSGFPGIVIAASHYRDYMLSGDTDDLDKMKSYIVTAHAVDASFATRYYLALYLYEKGEYDRTLELTRKTRSELTGVTRWAGVIDRAEWQGAVAELTRAAEAAKKGETVPKSVYLELDPKPQDSEFFEVEFKI